MALFRSQPKKIRLAFEKKLEASKKEKETRRQQAMVKSTLVPAYNDVRTAHMTGVPSDKVRSVEDLLSELEAE